MKVTSKGVRSLESPKIMFLRRAGAELQCRGNGHIRRTSVSKKFRAGRTLLRSRRAEMKSSSFVARFKGKNCPNPRGKVDDMGRRVSGTALGEGWQ